MPAAGRCYEETGQRQAVANLAAAGIEGLVVIGGDGSLHGALALHRLGVPVIGVPASIDNDIPFTDMSLGVDTALNNIVHAVDCLKDTASSHDRTFVVETMGRNSGYLALAAAIACGAEYALIPEVPFDIEEICTILRRRFQEGRDNSIIMVAEGVAGAQEIADRIQDCIDFETRIMVLGHYQRGGSPPSSTACSAPASESPPSSPCWRGRRARCSGFPAPASSSPPWRRSSTAAAAPSTPPCSSWPGCWGSDPPTPFSARRPATAAWPRAIPPSLGGTREWVRPRNRSPSSSGDHPLGQ